MRLTRTLHLWLKRTNRTSDVGSPSMHKISALDSVRGIAAFSVVIWHLMSKFFPAALGEGIEHTPFDSWLYKTPLASLFSGSFAVQLFFILSGFVLTVRYFSAPSHVSLFPAGVKRYFRLMPVAFVSILFAYTLLSLGFYQNSYVAATITGSPWAGSYYYAFDPNLLGAIWQGLVGIFASEIPPSLSYNAVLWTIYYELLGSLLIFGIATLSKGKSKRWVLYVTLMIAFIHTPFVGFILGMIVADSYANFPKHFAKISHAPVFYKLGALLAAFCIAGYPSTGNIAEAGRYWSALTLFPSDPTLSRVVLQLLAGVTVIILALSWRRFARTLEHALLVWLGKVSYSLYAVHQIVINMLTLSLFVRLYKSTGSDYLLSTGLAAAITIPVVLFLATLIYKYVEAPSISLANRVGSWSKDS